MNEIPRRDGRTKFQPRQITILYDGLARVDGSARFSFGSTISTLASISGPIEVRLAAENPSKATFEVQVRPLSGVPSTESKALAVSLRSALEPSLILTRNPRTLVQLVVQNLSNSSKDRKGNGRADHSLAAAMINASTLALLNASSVPMKGVVAAISVGVLSDGAVVVDPSDEEAKSLRSGGCFAFLFADVTGLDSASGLDCVWTSWRGGEREMKEAREVAEAGAKVVYEAMRRSVRAVYGDSGSVQDDDDDDDKMEI